MNASHLIKKSMILSSLRKLALFTPLLCVNHAYAGTDTLVNFMNLSPYSATVSFPADAQECWNDTGAESDNRISEYQGYFRASQVSDTSFASYMKEYQGTFGIKDLATVQSATMAGTQLTMNPATSKKNVSFAAFRGETSANLGAGCKNYTSSRGFDVVLKDTSGNVVSQKRYLLQDPPDSEWKLSRMKDTDLTAVDQTLVLGSGGKAYPFEIVDVAVSAGLTYLTVLSIGTAGPELYAARAMYATFFRQAGYSGMRLFARTSWEMGKFFLVGGLRTTSYGAIRTFQPTLTNVKGLRLLTALVADGIVTYGTVKMSNDGKDEPTYVETTDPDFSTAGLDMSSPQLVANKGLPASRSVCAYETKTLGFITECRVVGINLTIMPDGSIVYLPLPPVGSGT